MPSNINIGNQGPSIAQVTTSVSPALSSKYWGVTGQSAPSGRTTQILWVDRNEGITNGQSWQFTSTFTFQGVSIKICEYLTGTFSSSDIQIEITAGGQSTGFQSDDTSLGFTDTSGGKWLVTGHFFLNGSYDDVTYTIAPQ